MSDVLFDEVSRCRQEITRLTREIERLTLDGIHTCHAECQRPACRLTRERDEARRTVREAHEAGTRLTAQRNALLEALKEYGWHHEGCPQYPTHTHPDRWPACTCGFDAAIKAVEENT